MEDTKKTKAQLIAELEELRNGNTELEVIETEHKRVGLELVKESTTLDKIINLNPYSISVYDAEGHFLMGNQAYFNLFGSTPPLEYSLFDDPLLKRAGIQEELLKLKKGETITTPVDVWYNPHDLGSDLSDRKVCTRGVAFPILDRDGNVENIIIMHEDITERKRAGEALRKSEERYKELVENINEVIYSIDKNGVVTYISPAIEELLGYSPSEIVGKSFINFVNEEDLQLMKNNFQEILYGDITSNEYRVLTKGGEIRWINTSSKPVHMDNVPFGLHGVLIDITERKRAEQALLESEEKYRDLADLLPQTVFELDLEGNFTFSNRFGFESSGYTKEDIDRGLNVLQLIVPEERERVKRNIDKILSGEKPKGHEYTAVRKDGSTFPVLIYTNPIIRDNKPVGLRGIVIDITDRKHAEKSLRESEERYRTIFETAAVSFWEYDFSNTLAIVEQLKAEGISDFRKYFLENPETAQKIISSIKLVDVNDTTLKLYGAGTKEELIAAYGKHLTPESYKTFIDAGIAYIEGERYYECETVNQTLDGRRINILLCITFPYTYQNHNIALVTVTDITGRKLAEEALKKSENLLRSTLDAIPAMLSVHDRDFNILYSNWKGFADVSMEKRITGEKCYKIYHNQNTVCPDCLATTVFETRQPFFKEMEIPEGVFDLRVIPVIDENGDVPMFLEYVEDITARKRSEDALRESEARLSEAELMAQFGSGDWDIVSNTLEWSKGLYSIYGITPEKFSKKYESFLDFVHPDDRERITKNVELALKENKPINHEYRIIRADGSERTIHAKAEVTFDENGNGIRMMGTAHDITEFKQLEEERSKADKLESIGILAGGIAHDFNNILTAIIGNISLAKMSIDRKSDEYEILADAEDACLQAKNLTKQLLTFSRGGAPVKETAFVSDIIKDSAGFSLRGSNVKSTLSIAKDLWASDVDRGQINQVINNLLINADQAMPEGGIITIYAENVTVTDEDNLPLKDGNYVKISIEDQGTGISEEHLPKIFDPYFTTKQKGSGLGLATTYSIIHQHGGYISVESEMGTGTTFHIYLPASSKQVEKKEDIEEDMASLRGKILLMDDEKSVSEVVSKMLTHLGNEVETVKDDIEAIELYQKEMKSGKPFDVVILDLTVPGGMGGKKAIQKLLEIDPEIKAIVSSGYSNDSVVANYKKYGFKENISKPYKMKELKKVLNNVMAEKKQ